MIERIAAAVDDDDDDEPMFRVHYVVDHSNEEKSGHWEEYNPLKKRWFRLCHKCRRKVCKSSDSLCTTHSNQENRSQKMAKKLKRLEKRSRRKKNRQRKLPLETIVVTKGEIIVNSENKELSDSLNMVISVSSSLNKNQISQVKEFLALFANKSQPIEWTCESQIDHIDDTTTHVITNDSGSFTTILTKQIIQACVRHIFIGSFHWIIDSLNQLSVLDHFPYEILRDRQSFNTSRGIKQCRFDQLPVFPSSCVISVECQLGLKEWKMTRSELLEIVELSGATVYNEYIACETLIILCSSRREMLRRQKQDDDLGPMINAKKIYFCKPDFLFDSIVRHEVQSIEIYVW